jgi:hypothetical protein
MDRLEAVLVAAREVERHQTLDLRRGTDLAACAREARSIVHTLQLTIRAGLDGASQVVCAERL